MPFQPRPVYLADSFMLPVEYNEQFHVNDVPIRRLYKKTIEGVVDLADTAFRHLGLKK